MRKDVYDKIIGFLQGASWAVVLFGALLIFKFSLIFGLALAIFFTLFYIIISLLIILTLDAFSVNKKKLEELKKHTKLLEKIYSKHTN